MYKKYRLLLVVFLCTIAMFNNVAWGQRNQEIYNLEADWQKSEANYREQLNRCRENLRKFERELQQYEQEEKQLVASGAKENPDYIALGEPALLRVRKEIFVVKEDIEATKNEIRRIEDQINNGRQNLEYMKQKIQQRIEEEARRQREAKAAEERRQREEREAEERRQREAKAAEERRQREAREAEAKRQRDEEQRQVELRNQKRKEQEAREAAEKKRKQEEDQRRAEEQRRKAEEERIREEQRREEQRRKDEERRAEIDRKYKESKRKNQPRIDRWVSSQNEAFERDKEYFDEKKSSDYSTNSVMSEQRGSLGGSYSTARLNKNNIQNNSDELQANVGNSILQKVKKKEQNSEGLDLNVTSTSSSIVIDPDKPFSFKQESEWNLDKFIIPINLEYKESTFSVKDADLWNYFNNHLGKRQSDMLAISLMQRDNGNIPKFIALGEDNGFIMEGKKGDMFIISYDGHKISTISDEEKLVIKNWMHTDFYEWTKEDTKLQFIDKNGKINPKISGKIKIIDKQNKHERNWIYVNEVVSGNAGYSYAYGPEANLKADGSINLPSADIKTGFKKKKDIIDSSKKKKSESEEEEKKEEKIKKGYNLGKVEGKIGADLSLAEAKGNVGLGFTTKVFGKYVVVNAQGSLRGSVGAGAEASAKVELLSGKKLFSGKVYAGLQAAIGVKGSGALDIYIYDVEEVHNKIQEITKNK